MFTLTTLFVIAGGIAASVGIVALTGDGKGGSSDGSVANNPFSEWDFHQPYNP